MSSPPLRGIGDAKALRISRDFRRQALLRRLMEFLCSHELKPILAVRLYRFYGEEAMSVLEEDPVHNRRPAHRRQLRRGRQARPRHGRQL